MNERHLPKYQPNSHDNSLRRASDVTPGSGVIVYFSGKSITPFKAEVLGTQETNQPGNPRVLIKTTDRVYQKIEGVPAVIHYSKQILPLGAGTSMRIIPKSSIITDLE